ncbi:MAG: addiction module protein [Planctomycetes bacterium]|nr:addiction module protein [Planctomycetota bacterium]
MTAKQVTSRALRLSPRDRARLAKRLIASLEKKHEEGCEQAWYDEAVRRDKACREGRLPGRPAEDVFRRVAARLQ